MPDLHAHYVKLLALLTQRLVPECHALAADAVLEAAIQPESVPPVASSYTQILLLAVNHIVVHTAVREGFEAHYRVVGGRACSGGVGVEVAISVAWREELAPVAAAVVYRRAGTPQGCAPHGMGGVRGRGRGQIRKEGRGGKSGCAPEEAFSSAVVVR